MGDSQSRRTNSRDITLTLPPIVNKLFTGRYFVALLLMAAGALGAGFFPQRNQLLLPDQSDRTQSEKPSQPNATGSRPDGLFNGLIAALSDGAAGQAAALELLAELDVKILQDPSGTWRDLLATGERGKPSRRWVANRLGAIHGAALLSGAQALDDFPELPIAALLSGCARRPDPASEIAAIMAWAPARKGERYQGRGQSIRHFAYEWAKLNKNTTIPWPDDKTSERYRDLAKAGAELGLSGGVIGSYALNDPDAEWMAKNGKPRFEYDFDYLNVSWPSRSALQFLEKSSDITVVLENAKKSRVNGLVDEIIAVSIVRDPGSIEKILRFAEKDIREMRSLADQLGAAFPEKGKEWLSGLDHSKPEVKAAVSAFIAAQARRDPLQAFELCLSDKMFASLSDDDYKTVMVRCTERDPMAAAALFDRVDKNEASNGLRLAAMNALLASSPAYFQEKARQGTLPDFTAQQASRWASSLAGKQGAEGAGWAIANIKNLEPAELGESATRGLALRDSQEGSKFANSLEPGPVRDGAATALVSLTAEAEPQSAFEWALSIADSTRRERAVTQSLRGLERAGLALEPYLERAGITTWPATRQPIR